MARRSLLTRAGAVGAGALAASLVLDRSALASPSETDLPASPTAADTALLQQALGLELALSDLYAATVDAGPSAEVAMVAGVVGQNHLAYAQSIAGITGVSVRSATPSLFDANVDAFTSSEDGFLEAARQLENQAAATHSSLLPSYESVDAIRVTASILVMEARYATVWADFLGEDDLDTVFENDASPLPLSSSGGA